MSGQRHGQRKEISPPVKSDCMVGWWDRQGLWNAAIERVTGGLCIDSKWSHFSAFRQGY